MTFHWELWADAGRRAAQLPTSCNLCVFINQDVMLYVYYNRYLSELYYLHLKWIDQMCPPNWRLEGCVPRPFRGSRRNGTAESQPARRMRSTSASLWGCSRRIEPHPVCLYALRLVRETGVILVTYTWELTKQLQTRHHFLVKYWMAKRFLRCTYLNKWS